MTDLEIMLMLEEEGYEPSIENVQIFKEEYLQESYSDYELYQLLDESGYKPTEKNLSILKEGLESGKYIVISENKEATLKARADAAGRETAMAMKKLGLPTGAILRMSPEANAASKALTTHGMGKEIAKLPENERAAAIKNARDYKKNVKLALRKTSNRK